MSNNFQLQGRDNCSGYDPALSRQLWKFMISVAVLVAALYAVAIYLIW